MSDVSFTLAEARVIEILRRDKVATVAEIAVYGRLSPGDAWRATERLRDEGVITDEARVRLTDYGNSVASAPLRIHVPVQVVGAMMPIAGDGTTAKKQPFVQKSQQETSQLR